jgi:hypothetical protein
MMPPNSLSQTNQTIAELEAAGSRLDSGVEMSCSDNAVSNELIAVSTANILETPHNHDSSGLSMSHLSAPITQLPCLLADYGSKAPIMYSTTAIGSHMPSMYLGIGSETPAMYSDTVLGAKAPIMHSGMGFGARAPVIYSGTVFGARAPVMSSGTAFGLASPQGESTVHALQ